MPTPAKKPATTPIPVQLSATEFTRIYLAAPLHAQAWTQVQTRLSSRLQPHLMGALHRHAMEVLARAHRSRRQGGHPLHHRLQSLRPVVRRRLTGAGLHRQCGASGGRTTSSISACCMAMAPTRWPKKAATALAIRATNTRRARKSSPSSTTTGMCWLPCRWHRSMKRIRCCSLRG